MEKNLKDFKPGEKGIVKKIVGEGQIKRRLFDMGITPGTEISMQKSAPLSDPIQLNIRNYGLSLRKSEASSVIVEVEGNA